MPDLSSFWSGLSDLFGKFTSSVAQGLTSSPGVMGSEEMYGAAMPTSGFNATASTDAAGGWGSIGKEFLKGAAPGIGQAAVGAGAQALFPGQGGKVIGLDARTPEGKQADASRLTIQGKAADELMKGLSDKHYGTLSPEMQAADLDDIRRQRRSTDAARGMLETGGSGRREAQDTRAYMRDRENERNATINQRFGQAYAGTQGFNPQSTFQTPATTNPWAKILTSALAPGVGKGIEKSLERWAI